MAALLRLRSRCRAWAAARPSRRRRGSRSVTVCARDVEPAAAALRVQPALEVHALGVVAHEQVVGPLRVARPWPGRAAARCAPRRRSETRSRRASPHQGQGISSMACLPRISAPRRPRRARRSGSRCGSARARRRRSDRCGWSWAMVWANTQPEPGVALKPPVPQPQLMYRPSTGVLPMIGLASGQMSTMPPHCRIMRRRRKRGTARRSRASWSSMTWQAAALGIAERSASMPAPITSSPLSDWLT